MNLRTAKQHNGLRASDLVPGHRYYAPSGRLCELLKGSDLGLDATCYRFAYVSRSGSRLADDVFSISTSNARAIAAMRPADGPTLTPAGVVSL